MEPIKRLNQYTDDELAVMDIEQVEELIKIECMCDGVATEFMRPNETVLPSMPMRDKRICEFCFSVSDEEEAKATKTYINSLTSRCKEEYEYTLGYDCKYIKDISSIGANFNSKPIYSEGEFLKVKPILASIKTIKEANAELLDNYSEKIGSYHEIREKAFNAYYSAINNKSQLEKAVEVYKEYLRLSNNNSDIAENFFKQSIYGRYYDEVIATMAEVEE
ncbi:MAG: hypothetical protein ACK5MV_13745 [Aminipila sp.]